MAVSEPETMTTEQARELLEQHSNKELLRLISCGSVDDGKSTLIGRLMLAAGAVHDDQIVALRKDTERHGTTDDDLDPALLLDGLEDERQQGITIDVAYRYFTTAKRKFIIADTPGHEQFTRNMATGASCAELALILVDASKGLLTQTRRHAFIVSLLGIQHAIVVVNKMDLVDYDQVVFERIRDQFRRFAEQLDIADVRFVPVSALKGDNVAEPSARMLWYDGGSLLHLLEEVYVGGEFNTRDLRFPVQWVNRRDAAFRGYSGSIASGTLRAGDEVYVLPSKRKTRVQRIATRDGVLDEAGAPLAVTVTLEDEVDVTRGDMIVRVGNCPRVTRDTDAMIVWMSEQPLVPGKQYFVKHTTRRTSGEIVDVRYTIDVNTLHRQAAASLKLNEIGRCRVAFHDPLMVDPYRQNRHTGAFILVDRVTHETVAAGMVLDVGGDVNSVEHWDDDVSSAQLQRANSLIDAGQRRVRYAQQPVTVLITGLSGAGKTTLALELEKRLFQAGKSCVVLDGQNLRFGISRDLGFTAAERSENLRRAAEIAKTLNDHGLICLAAFVAPHADVRGRVRELIGEERFVQVHLQVPLEVCRARDATGRYEAADRGEITDFPGVTSRYDEPDPAALVLRADQLSPDACSEEVWRMLTERGFLRP